MPPHDLNVEMMVLGAIMTDQAAADYALGALKQSDFYDGGHKTVFRACASIHERREPVTLPAVSTELGEELDKLGGYVYLMNLMDKVLSVSNTENDCRILARLSMKRDALRIFRGAIDQCNDAGPLDVDAVLDQLGKLTHDRPGSRTIPPLAERLKSKRESEREREPGELLGYKLTRFFEIAQGIDGVQPGFYLFAGITHVGKTAFLTNIFYDLLATNRSLHGVYFSLDDNENVIFNRLLATICDGELQINQLQRRISDPKKRDALDGAYNELIGLAESGRFNIMDFGQIQTIESVESVIKSNVRDGRQFFAVIDGLQNIETGKEYAGLRQKNVDLAANVKRLVDVYQIPIFTSVELRKRANATATETAMPGLDDIMETGKYAYNASHVWIAHPEGEEYDNFIHNQKPEYTLTVATKKSKISGSVGGIKIVVKRACNKMIIENNSQGPTEPLPTTQGRPYTRRKK